MSNMIVTTLDGIAGRMTQETLGVVRGTSLWTRRVMKSSFGGIRHMQVTGVKDLDAGLNEAKERAHEAMIAEARRLGADSIIGVKIDVIEMSNGVFCVSTTGTAVTTLVLPATIPTFDGASPAASAEADDDADFDMGFLMTARPSFEGSQLRH